MLRLRAPPQAKAKLTFFYDPDNADDVRRIRIIQNAEKYLGVLWDLDQDLRGKIKYEDKNELQDIRTTLHDLLREEGINLDEDMT